MTRLLRIVGTAILAGGIALALASTANAQSGQNGQQQDGTSGTTPTNNNNMPYTPPAVPSGDASTGTGRGNGGSGTGGFGGGQNGSSGNGIGRIGANNQLPDETPENQQQLEMRQARARNAERQKQLVEDTQKLAVLANELQDEVSKSSKDMLSLDVVRKADEIEKLARNVRDRMKNAD